VCNDGDTCLLLGADQCARSSRPFKCSICAKKYAAAHFPVKVMGVS
jgi:hypothetical protein